MSAEPAQPPADAQAQTPKGSISKDRNCPYCNQAFTSSSLGRHLDLYIKPRNAKPPDGIHNVDEIRRIRGNITRRQARTSSLKREREARGQDSLSQSASSVQGSAEGGSELGPQNATVKQILEQSEVNRQTKSPTLMDQMLDKRRIFINKAHNWIATGVINDLPPRQDPLEKLRLANGSGGSYGSQADGERSRAFEDELDDGRAASLALKEVLGSVWEASGSDARKAIFDFDPLQHGFPGLCLRILPAPTTIFSSNPFSSNESWSIDPPDKRQFTALKAAVEDRIQAVHAEQQALAQLPRRRDSDDFARQRNSEPSKDKILAHISDAYIAWGELSETQRRETWQLESFRAFAQAEEARKEAENTLSTLRKQVESLTSELQRSQNRLGGYATSPPPFGSTGTNPYGAFGKLRMGNDTLKQLNKDGIDIHNWDYDALVEKWKGSIKEDRRQQAIANGFRTSPTQRSPQGKNEQIALSAIAGLAEGQAEAGASRPAAEPASAQAAPIPGAQDSTMDDSPINMEDAEPDSDAEMEDGGASTHPAQSEGPQDT